MKKKTKILLGISLVLLCLILPGFYNATNVVQYQLSAEGVSQSIRIALVTDLHSCNYGEGMRELLDIVDAQSPDLVLLGGDIFDDILPDDNTNAFLKGISGRYPSYYVTGNHEYWSGEEGFANKMSSLKKWGIHRLSGEAVTIDIKNTHLTLCGVDDPYAWNRKISYLEHSEGSFEEQLAQVASQLHPESYNILLTHRPERFAMYSEYDFDLVLAGHAHGGQWRIPGILNGVYAPNQGKFPDLAGGLYTQNGTTMIVSRGLARESTWVPRIYNRPELVMIELTPK